MNVTAIVEAALNLAKNITAGAGEIKAAGILELVMGFVTKILALIGLGA